MLAFLAGVLTTLTVLVVCLYVFPKVTRAFRIALFAVRKERVFIWAIFDTFLRQFNLTNGGRLKHLTRRSRRRISRELGRWISHGVF